MSTVPATPTWWQLSWGLVKTALGPLVVFLATAGALWWYLPARPSLFLPDGQKFVAFSKDSRALITARAHRHDQLRAEVYAGPIQSWDISTGQVRRLPAAAEGDWQVIVLSPDERLVATQRDKELKLWEVSTGRLLTELRAEDRGWDEPRRGPYFEFSPDGDLLAYVSPVDDGHPRDFPHTRARIWDIVQSREKAVIDDVVFFGPLRFSPDGRILAATSQRGRTPDASPIVMLWDVARREELAVFTAYSGQESDLFVRSLAFAPDGQTLASGTDSKSPAGSATDAPAEVTLWDVRTRQRRCTIQTKRYDDVSALRFEAAGRALGAEYGGRTLFGSIDVNELYDLAAQPPRKLREIYGPMILHPGRGRVAWSNETEVASRAVGVLLGYPAPDPDARTVQVTVLDLGGMKETVLCRVDTRLGGLRPLAFSPDGRDLAVRVTTTESAWSRPSRVLWGERYIRLYDAGSGRTRAWFRGGSDIRFAPDGTAVATLGDGPIRLYRLPAWPSLGPVFGGATMSALIAFWIISRRAVRRRWRAATSRNAPPPGPAVISS
jgi:WD40 repeat protein